MNQIGTLHLENGSIPLKPQALVEAKGIVRHDWERRAVESLEKWWDSQDFVEMKTSGSTGHPRLIRHQKDAMEASAVRTLEHFRLNPGDHAALAMPADFVGGLMMLIRAVRGGLNLTVLEPKLAPKFPTTHFDFVPLTPAQCSALSKLEEQVVKMKNWKALLLGGASVQVDLVDKLPKGLKVFESFGMTETISHFAVRQWAPHREEMFRCLHGAEVSASLEGALQIHQAGCPMLRSNDAVQVIDRHSFLWLGRLDDVINTGGVKVYPQNVEAVLSSLISEPFKVFGRSHSEFGQEVVLRIHANEEPDNAEHLRMDLKKLASESLSKYHSPRTIEWKPLEKTQSGKWISPR